MASMAIVCVFLFLLLSRYSFFPWPSVHIPSFHHSPEPMLTYPHIHTNPTHTYALTPDDSPLPLLGWPLSPSFIHPSLLPSPDLKGQVTRAQEAEENYLVKRELATVKQQSEDTSAQLEQAHNTIRQLQQIHHQQGVSTSTVSQRHLEGWRNDGALTGTPHCMNVSSAKWEIWGLSVELENVGSHVLVDLSFEFCTSLSAEFCD